MSTLGVFQPDVDRALNQMRQSQVVSRIWAHDQTVWKPDPTEITNRLSWLDLPQSEKPELSAIADFVREVIADGFAHVLLLGMGGSSLAPEVFSLTFADLEGRRLSLDVLDSTEPGAVLAKVHQLDPAKTLYVVSTKSGGTVETLSFFKFCYNRVMEIVGEGQASRHFIAITDPGSGLEKLAQSYDFRKIFLNDPDIGGRFSALSLFGLVPAGLVGVDLGRLLDEAESMAAACKQDGADNPGAELGAALGTLAQTGRNKLTLALSSEIASLGDWIEQLVAESTGKEGVGILPVVGEPLAAPDAYGDDRLFVAITLQGDTRYDAALDALLAAGHPVLRLSLADRYALGGQFFLWEFATAVAGHFLAINPFDQPNVESAKVLAREAVKAFAETGQLPEVAAADPAPDVLADFLTAVHPGDYIALQAYVQPTPETDRALQQLRLKLYHQYGVATTVGYGPRFLHSTGQLHKGDDGRGVFMQFVADPAEDASIPDTAGEPQSSLTFGTLVRAQANGDRDALLDAGRRVIRFDLGGDVLGGLEALAR